MNKNLLLITGGVGTLSVIGGVVYYKKEQNKKITSEEFSKKLEELLNPDTKGLSAENAFDIHYLDQVKRETGRTILILKKEAYQNTQRI